MVAFKPITSVISTAINSFPNRKLLDYSFKEQWLDIMPSLLISVVMGAAIYTVNYSGWTDATKLFVQVIAGIVIYTGLSYLLKLECFIYLLDTAKQLLGKNTERKWNCNE